MGRPNWLDWGTAGELDDIEGQVAIVGVGEAKHSKASGRSSPKRVSPPLRTCHSFLLSDIVPKTGLESPTRPQRQPVL